MVPLSIFKHSSICLVTIPRRCFFCGSFLLFVFQFCLYYTVLSVPRNLVIICLEGAVLLALLFIVFSCVFVAFPYGVRGQVWYLTVSVPANCPPPYINCCEIILKNALNLFQVSLLMLDKIYCFKIIFNSASFFPYKLLYKCWINITTMKSCPMMPYILSLKTLF